MRIAIATDTPGWHGEQLRAAFAQSGVQTQYVSLRACRFDTGTPQGLFIPGFEDCLPDGVFVRQVPGGTLEQVVLRLDYLHALKECGVLVYNDGRVIERSVDKAMTSWLLHRAGVPTPLTTAGEPSARACGGEVEDAPADGDGEGHASETAHAQAGHPLGPDGSVIKPLFGSQGKGLRRLEAGMPMPAPEEFAGVLYAQRFIPPGAEGYRDWRVFVIDGVAVAAMQRRGRDWISNVAQGASCAAVPAGGVLAELAEAACAAVGAAYAGVDLMCDPAGAWYVIEVNGIPAWQGLQSVCGFSIAQRLADSFLARC